MGLKKALFTAAFLLSKGKKRANEFPPPKVNVIIMNMLSLIISINTTSQKDVSQDEQCKRKWLNRGEKHFAVLKPWKNFFPLVSSPHRYPSRLCDERRERKLVWKSRNFTNEGFGVGGWAVCMCQVLSLSYGMGRVLCVERWKKKNMVSWLELNNI